jgi:hypothetical protein
MKIILYKSGGMNTSELVASQLIVHNAAITHEILETNGTIIC